MVDATHLRTLLGAALAWWGLYTPAWAGANEPLALATLEGESVRVAPASPDQTLLLHFWATWCTSCVEEFPALASALRGCDRDRLRLVTVNVGDSAEEIREFVAAQGLELEVLRDPRSRVWRKLSGADWLAQASPSDSSVSETSVPSSVRA